MNAADRPVLLLGGEELVGGEQNRVLDTTVLVAARAEVRIPVSCVEPGRWAYRGRRFTAGGVSLFAAVRTMKIARVTASLRTAGRHVSDQSEIWDELARRADLAGVASPTADMHAVYETYADRIERAQRALAAGPAQAGALVFIGGEWAGLELLASPGLFARAWPRLLAGYAAETLAGAPAASTGAPEALVRSAREVLDLPGEAPVEPAPAVGLGDEYRLVGDRLVGAGLVADGRVAHLAALPAPHGGSPGSA